LSLNPKAITFRYILAKSHPAHTCPVMPLKVETDKSSLRRKLPISRLISLASLALAITALVLALRKPQPVAVPQPPRAMAANAASFQSKVEQLASPSDGGPNDVRLTAPEIAAALAQSAGALPNEGSSRTAPVNTPANLDVSGAVQNVGEPVVTFEGDQVKGQFVSEVGG
jgi:hypothetical protein